MPKSELEKYLISFKKVLSALAEKGGEEYETQAFIIESLRFFGFSPHICAETGVICLLDAKAKKALAFRADMDGLPREGEYAHLCGHDGHMAMLLAFAYLFRISKSRFPVNILLIFQPAEEREGAAARMIAEGILDEYNVCEVYGFHVWPSLEKGFIASKSGYLFCRSSELNINIKGISAHGASAKDEGDALYAASLVSVGIREIAGTMEGEALCRICMLTAGSALNVVADKAYLSGVIRALTPKGYEEVSSKIAKLCRDISEKCLCEITFEASGGYIALKNSERLYEKTKKLLAGSFREAQSCFLADDFAYFCAERPGLYMLLGVGDGGEIKNLHSIDFDFDPSCLMEGLMAYETIAQNAHKVL